MRFLSSIFLAIAILTTTTQARAELKAENLIVVYNGKMAGSESVARHYAEKRGVPLKNLLGVNLSTSEEMGYGEYENKLLPPLRKAIEKLRAERKAPAILLVYGIPLKIKEGKEKKVGRAFKELSSGKVKELQGLVLNMIMAVELITGRKSNQSPATTEEIVKMGEETSKASLRFITAPPANRQDRENKLKVASIIFQMTGLSSVAREIEKTYRNMSPEEMTMTKVDGIVRWNAILERQLNEVRFTGAFPENAGEVASAVRLTSGILGELMFWNNLMEKGDDPMNSSSVDSELSLIMAGPYQRNRWLANPLSKIYDRLPGMDLFREKIVMVGRLDGPTPEIAKRLVDDAVEVEERGLKGTFYIDARGIQKKDSYGTYDGYLYTLYDMVNKKGKMKALFDDKEALFLPKCCKDAALYVGWYSLGKYIDSFEWVKGSVAFHIASEEASTLRKKGRQVWVKRMLEEGVAASIGPVSEPYVDSFPLPHVFFPLLMTGRYTLLEAYYESTPYLSWRQLVIGDPLYRPFKKKPAINLD